MGLKTSFLFGRLFANGMVDFLRDSFRDKHVFVPVTPPKKQFAGQEYSTGHAFHTYTLTSSDGSVQQLVSKKSQA